MAFVVIIPSTVIAFWEFGNFLFRKAELYIQRDGAFLQPSIVVAKESVFLIRVKDIRSLR